MTVQSDHCGASDLSVVLYRNETSHNICRDEWTLCWVVRKRNLLSTSSFGNMEFDSTE